MGDIEKLVEEQWRTVEPLVLERNSAMTDSIVVKPLTPDLAEAYAQFFDVTPHDDGSNKDELPCYCVTWRSDAAYAENPNHWFPTREERRARAIEYVKSGHLRGYLAYLDGEIVGWCNANADCQACLGFLRTVWPMGEHDPAVKIKPVFCFMIAPKAQKMGVATKLLTRICEDAVREGFDFVQAQAYAEGKAPPYDFTGPVALYERLGFVKAAEKDGFVVMRKGLRG
jgi:GNAT superfamily N-acetyltransferase